MHHKNKKHFDQNRFIFFAEVPQFSESELEAVKKAKGEEKDELKIGDLVNAVNGEVNKHSEQLAELPKEYNDLLHNEIKGYLERSTGRYEKDNVKGLSSDEFTNYVAGMKAKVEEMMKEWAPTEEDIKAKKEAEKKQSETKQAAEKVMPAEQREKILSQDPSAIQSLEGLGTAFDAYDQANSEMQQDAIKVFKPVADFQKSYAEYKKARGGVKAYKQFSAYLWPEDDTERINIQDSLNGTKTKVSDAKKKFSEQKKTLSEYSDKLGNVSNKLKEDKIAERDKRLKELDDKSENAEKERALRQEKYNRLEGMQLKLFGQMKRLGEYHDNIKEAREKQEKKVLVGQEGEQKLADFKDSTDASLAQVTEALQNPNLTEDAKKKLEDTKKQLEDRAKAVDTGMQVMGDTVKDTQDNINKLEEGDQKTAAQTLNVDSHLKDQVQPTLKALNESVLALEESKMQFSTDKTELTNYYKGVIDGLDGVDESVDGAILKNNVANTQIEKQLDSLSSSLDKADVSPPSGLGGAFEATVGVPFRMMGGGLSWVGEKITDLGKGMCDQGKQLSKWVEDIKDSPFYWPARIGSEIVNFPIGVAGGIVEMAGGLVTLGGNLVAHPVDTVAGLGAMIGRDPNTGEWSLSNAGRTWKEIGKAVISYEDFEQGHIGLALGKIFPNVVITIETLGSAPGAKVATQAATSARVAFAAARAEGASVLRATARAAGTFVTEGVVVLAGEAKNLPKVLRTFFAGGEGEANILARLADKYKAFSQISVGEAATAVGETFGALGKATASKLETYWGGTRFESYRLGKLAGQQLALVDELGSTTGKYQEYQQALAKLKNEIKAGNAALTEEEISAIARYRLGQQNRELALAGSQHEEMLSDLAKNQKAFEDQVTKGMSEGNKEKAGKLLENRNAAQKGMVETGQGFSDFKKLLDAKDPKAMEAARQFQEALITRDPKLIKAWKDANWSKLPKEWQAAFQNMEYRMNYAVATQDISMVQSADRLEKSIARLPDDKPETISRFIEDYNKKYPGVATGEPRILYKLPEGKGAIVIGPDGKAVYLEKSALDTHFTSVFSEQFTPGFLQENFGVRMVQKNGQNFYIVDGKQLSEAEFLKTPKGKEVAEASKKTPAWIDDEGKIHYNNGYFEDQFGVRLKQQEGKNVFVVEGKEMSPIEFFRTEQGKEVLQAMKRVKDHEVTHRLLEATDKASGGKLGAQWQKMIVDNPELLARFASRGEKLTPRSAQEFLCEVADGRVKLSAEAVAELEETLGGSIRGFSFDAVRKLDTKMLNFSSPNALERSFEDAFTLNNPHAILNDRNFKMAFELAQSRYPEIFKATGEELQRIMESGPEIQRKALAYQKAMLRNKLMGTEEKAIATSTEKMQLTESVYKKFAEAHPEMAEEMWQNYRAAMKGTPENRQAVRSMYPVKSEIFDYIEANLRFQDSARKLHINSLKEKIERDLIEKSLGSKSEQQIQAYVDELNAAGDARPGEARIIAQLPKNKGSIFVNREGVVEFRRGKAFQGKAAEADLFDAEFEAEFDKGLQARAEADKIFVESFAKKYPVSPKIQKAITDGKITPYRLREIDEVAASISTPRASALTELLLEKPEVGAQVLRTIKKAPKGLLTDEHLDTLVLGGVDTERLALLDTNIANPQLTREYVEKIINSTPEALDGGKVKYFEGEHIGEGGVARVFRVAYYEPPSNKLRFTGCKKLLDENVGHLTLDREADAAGKVLQLKQEGMSTEHIINPLYVSADKTVIFYDIAEYSEGGVTKRASLGKLAEDPAAQPEQIFGLVLDNADALAELHSRGLYHLDVKPDNVVRGQQGGVMIDLGSVSSADEFVAGMNGGIPARTIRNQATGVDYWVGKIPNGIGVTPGYYSDVVGEGVAAGRLPMWKVDAYAMGIEIREMLTGKVPHRRFERLPNGNWGPGQWEEIQSGAAHTFANPAKNQEIWKLSNELTDPSNTTTTIAIASQRLRAILAMP